MKAIDRFIALLPEVLQEQKEEAEWIYSHFKRRPTELAIHEFKHVRELGPLIQKQKRAIEDLSFSIDCPDQILEQVAAMMFTLSFIHHLAPSEGEEKNPEGQK